MPKNKTTPNNNTDQPEGPVKLPPRYIRYAAAIAQGKSKRAAALYAGAKTVIAADKMGTRMSKNVHVQQLIDEALAMHGATPEFAVGVIKEVAAQKAEVGARRLAAKDILELHGWRKGEPPGVTLNVKNAFFVQSRNNRNTSVIDGEAADE